MSLNRYAARRDATEPAIRRALGRAGAQVLQLDVFDLLVLYRGQLTMLDCKTGRGRATATQRELVQLGWPLQLVRDPEAALRVIGAWPRV
ncbi:MAG TPA: hypothetical protein VGF35_09105 [Steroidobacteraceae bacterium]